MKTAATLVVLVALLAGCAAPAQEISTARPATPSVEIAADRPDTSYTEVATGPTAAPDLNATTAAAPKLVRGEWWRIQFHGGIFDALGVPDLVRVVADAQPDGYVMGMPHEGWFKEAIVFHFPAFGDINPDLSYDTHNKRFEPLRFPLTTGETWTTAFGGSPWTATVESADAQTATVSFEPQAGDPQPTDPVYGALFALSPLPTDPKMKMTYDARQHEVVKFESSFGGWDVVAHGYDYEGWVTVPRGEHTAIDHGQFLAATPGDAPVTRTVAIDGGFNRLTLLHLIAPIGPGAYRIRSIMPNGTAFTTEAIPGRSVTVAFYEARDPDGDWTQEEIVGGPGATYTMGMAYHQYDIRLPDGARRADHSHPVIR